MVPFPAFCQGTRSWSATLSAKCRASGPAAPGISSQWAWVTKGSRMGWIWTRGIPIFGLIKPFQERGQKNNDSEICGLFRSTLVITVKQRILIGSSEKKRKITASRSPTARPGRCILELFRVGVLVTIDSGGFFLHGCTLNNALSRKNYQKLTYVLNSKRNSETHGLDPQPHRTRVGSMRWKSPPDVAAKRLKTSCR
jgi:hypothetical protein